jgi:hypothetical protein
MFVSWKQFMYLKFQHEKKVCMYFNGQTHYSLSEYYQYQIWYWFVKIYLKISQFIIKICWVIFQHYNYHHKARIEGSQAFIKKDDIVRGEPVEIHQCLWWEPVEIHQCLWCIISLDSIIDWSILNQTDHSRIQNACQKIIYSSSNYTCLYNLIRQSIL